MDYAAGQAQTNREATPILTAMSELERAVTILEERGSELQVRLEPVLQMPSLKIANAPPDRPVPIDGRAPTPASPVLAGLQALRLRVDGAAHRITLLIKSMDV